MSDAGLNLGQASEFSKQLATMGVNPQLFNDNLLTVPERMKKLAQLIRSGLDFEPGVPFQIEINGVMYRHHPNGGGLVADTAHVDATVFVSPFSCVNANAIVLDNVRINGTVKIGGDAKISGEVQVSGTATISGSAVIRDNVTIDDNVYISGGLIHGHAHINDQVCIIGGNIYDNAVICGDSKIFGGEVCENAHMKGAKVSGLSKVFGNAFIASPPSRSGPRIYILDHAMVFDNAYIDGVDITICEYARICGDRKIRRKGTYSK